MVDWLNRKGVPDDILVDPTASPDVPLASGTTFRAPELGDWYTPVLIGADVIGEAARSGEMLESVEELLGRLTSDPYVEYLQAFYREGRERFGARWNYADITTVLMAAGALARPRKYLEIGVRRGRSMAMVAATCPECDIVGFDIWYADYAGIENPGPAFVREELAQIGHTGSLELIEGDSHETVSAYLSANPDAYFDLVTVDGDHRIEGAEQDLREVIPRMAVGGILVFDDTRHPAHPGLGDLWDRLLGSDERFSTWTYDDVGYGVAIAVRRA